MHLIFFVLGPIVMHAVMMILEDASAGLNIVTLLLYIDFCYTYITF